MNHRSFLLNRILTAALMLALALGPASCTTLKNAAKARPAAQAAPIAPGAYYDYIRSQFLRHQGEYGPAAESLEQAIAKDPGSVFLIEEAGQLHLALGDHEKATAMVKNGLALDPENTELLLLLAAIRLSGHDIDGAINAYSKTLAADPSLGHVYYVLAELYLKNEDTKNAVRIYKDAIRMGHEPFRGHFYLGEIHAEQGETEKAEKHFRETLKDNPDLDLARFALVEVYQQAGQKQKVNDTYHEIMDQGRVEFKAGFGLARFYLEEGQKDKADAVLASLVQRGQPLPLVQRQTGMLYLDLEDYAEAAKVFSAYLSENPGDPDAPYFLGMALERSGKKEQALEAYRSTPADSKFFHNAIVYSAILSNNPEDMQNAIRQTQDALVSAQPSREGLILLASLFELAHQYDRAAELLNQSIKDFGEDPEIYFRLGVVQDKWGKKEDCITSMKKAVELAPEDPNALNYLGYTYADLGIHLDEAERLVQKALEHKPGDGFIIDSLGWVHFRQGRFDEALENLTRAVELVPEEPTILEHLGDAQAKTGDTQAALATYQKALGLAKDDKAKKSLNKKIRGLSPEAGKAQ